MVVYRGFAAYRSSGRATAVAVGNFDGVHLGHRKILDCLRSAAHEDGLRTLVLTFTPHPERVLGKKDVRMIDTLEQKLAKLRAARVEAAVVTEFDRGFASLGQREFLEDILMRHLGAKEIVVGRNFRFGKNRSGGTIDLRRLGRVLGIGVHIISPVVRGGLVVSSSAIRRFLLHGKMEQANRMLGRNYEVIGRVVPGQARGRRLGYPTLNIAAENEILPDGIFVTETVIRGREYPSVTSIGTNPTFGRNPLSVETHLLNQTGGFPAGEAAIRFHTRIRTTKAFPSAAALAARIARDVEAAQAFFALRKS